MSLDLSFARAKELFAEVAPRLDDIETEQDARLQIINRVLTEVLGWDFTDIKTEPHTPSGYTDYLLSGAGQKRFVVEAKRIGPYLLSTLNPSTRTYMVGGPALAGAADGIKQAVSYCIEHGVNYAVVTTGVMWITFLPMPGAGVPYREGLAFAFPNFQSILDNFAIFYDLHSKEGITKKVYNLHFAKAGGLSVEAFEPLIAANRNENIRLMPPSRIATDLDPVFRDYFGALSSDTDRQMLIDCFVETRESKYADACLEKMVQSISAQISTLEANSENQLTQQIELAVESGRGETVILVGSNGAGKSTFLERFFDSVLEPSLRSRCLVVRVDLTHATPDLASLSSALTSELKSKLEKLLYADGQPTFDELQGLYWREYQGWMKGQYKPLYESDKTAFKNKFSDFLNQQMETNPYSYVLRMIEDAIKNRKLLPCLIFDNTDQFVDIEPRFQETVFQYSQAVHSKLPFTLIVLPVTDRSLWRLSKGGPFQTYPSKIYYLPVPPTKEVLEKRVEYLKRKVEEAKDQHSYFFTRGIRLTVENIRAFAACLEEIFLRTDFVNRRISWLGNNNLRKSLELTQKVITSPIFSVDDLVKAYIAYGSRSSLRLEPRKFMQALLHGNYNAFQQDHNDFIFNVFAISPYFPTTPLLVPGILKLLIDRSGGDAGISGYVSVEQVSQYFIAMGVSEPALDYALTQILGFGLIETYDASDESLGAAQRIAITYSGRMHFEMATTDAFFVGDMAFATPVRSTKLVDDLRALRSKRMGLSEWKEAQRLFFSYCREQDKLYVTIPKDDMYEGQRLMRQELQARWVEGSGVEQSVPATEQSAGLSYATTTVKWYSPGKGYGFVDAGLKEDVFFHRNNLQLANIESVSQGDILICDIAQGPKGRPQVIGVHSVQPAPQKETVGQSEPVDGKVEFYNAKRGYGFIKAESLPEDVYVTSRVIEESGLQILVAGSSVRVRVTKGRDGKGYMASALEIVRPTASAI